MTNINTSICNLDSIFLEGAYQTTSGLYIDTLSSINACDSIVITSLSVDSILMVNDTLSICYGDSAQIGSSYYDISGTYNDTTISSAGCDSITYTYLDVQPLSYSLDTIDICYGDSIFLGYSFQSTTGNYLDILTSASGCDSISEIHLNVKPQISHVDSVTICSLDSIYSVSYTHLTLPTILRV